jgi:NAD(P)-dependent dehydrogenase (short-subunit alcohol dehydrogenase family)
MSAPSHEKTWLITGCSSGLGRSLAERALAHGHRIIATARDVSRIDDLGAENPDRFRALTLDVTDAAQVKSVVEEATRAFGRIDVLVNNAGYGLVGALEELSDEQIARNFDTNFFGALALTRAVLPMLRAQKSGHIVNISAAAAIGNYPGFSIYGATKWALEGVSESLAAELKPLGIKVTIVQPGPFRTDFIARSLDRAATPIADYERSSGKFARFLASMDGKQPGDPQKAADAIIAAVDSAEPPLRLVLGRYATDKVRKKHAAAERELAAWEPIGAATEFSS